jgi:hypothetical protein
LKLTECSREDQFKGAPNECPETINLSFSPDEIIVTQTEEVVRHRFQSCLEVTFKNYKLLIIQFFFFNFSIDLNCSPENNFKMINMAIEQD